MLSWHFSLGRLELFCPTKQGKDNMRLFWWQFCKIDKLILKELSFFFTAVNFLIVERGMFCHLFKSSVFYQI